VQLAERIHLVGSGSFGFDLTDPYDCHIYLVDGGGELGLVDVGAGMGAIDVLENVRLDGFDPGRISHIVCTHAHGDHAGGAARMRSLLPHASLSVSRDVADLVRAGDERGASIDVARAAGIYPVDYRLEPCAVDGELVDGDRIVLGDVVLECIDTPGHARGHVSFILDYDGRRSLFGGDAVFYGGRILLQSTHDCSLQETIATLRKLRGLAIDALLPGHLAFSLTYGQRHIETANRVLDRLLVPDQMISAW
jgi:hydroxyacylglutathione hydrolase